MQLPPAAAASNLAETPKPLVAERGTLGALQNPKMNLLPALKNPKLLSQIFDAIEQSVGSSKRHLLWVALTCTTFREPALNSLWRSLDTLLPLLKLLSPFKVLNGVNVRSDPLVNDDC